MKRGLLLCNLGSPDSPSEPDVRRYLDEFLMDERVIDSPWLVRRAVISLTILPKRPKESAHAYSTIWWKEGSPLIVISRRLQMALKERLNIAVGLGMRYGNPSIPAALKELLDAEVDEIVHIPLYPHYAMSSYETAVLKVEEELAKLSPATNLTTIPPFYEDSLYINALCETAKPFLERPYDHLLFSYHGVPERHLRKSDPTHHHCLSNPYCCFKPSEAHATCYRHQTIRTTAAFTEKMGIPREKHSISYQSRLGKAPWIQPYTDEELTRLARSGVRKLLVISPAFVADCLETLEEIAVRGRETFLEAGGEEFSLIPCLNDQPAWVSAIENWVRDIP